MCVELSGGYRRAVPSIASLLSRDLFADEFSEDVVGNRLDFALRQTRRMRIAWRRTFSVASLCAKLRKLFNAVLWTYGSFVDSMKFALPEPAFSHTSCGAHDSRPDTIMENGLSVTERDLICGCPYQTRGHTDLSWGNGRTENESRFLDSFS